MSDNYELQKDTIQEEPQQPLEDSADTFGESSESDSVSMDPTEPPSIESGSSTTGAREATRYRELSGPDNHNRTKCHLVLRHYLQYSDGTTKTVEELRVTKPVIHIFSDGGYVHVFLDFGRPTDDDLRVCFALLRRYMSPENSVSYLPDEVANGYYVDENGNEELIYFPIMELALSPIGRETEFMVHGFRPLLFSLVSNEPGAALTVLQIVFKDNLFVVDESIGEIDRFAIQQEAYDEAMIEIYGDVPKDFSSEDIS